MPRRNFHTVRCLAISVFLVAILLPLESWWSTASCSFSSSSSSTVVGLATESAVARDDTIYEIEWKKTDGNQMKNLTVRFCHNVSKVRK